jgi:hypothetical protein
LHASCDEFRKEYATSNRIESGESKHKYSGYKNAMCTVALWKIIKVIDAPYYADFLHQTVENKSTSV